jgi:hypothetical protein
MLIAGQMEVKSTEFVSPNSSYDEHEGSVPGEDNTRVRL